MNTCTAKGWSKRALAALVLSLGLAACTQDTASYMVGGDKQNSILLIRNQTWFWESKVQLTIAPSRLPECTGSLEVEGVPKDAEIQLYRAPDEYAEPIFVLKTGDRHFAVSTVSCRVQEFKEPPEELGTHLGVFGERDGVFGFEAAEKGTAET